MITMKYISALNETEANNETYISQRTKPSSDSNRTRCIKIIKDCCTYLSFRTIETGIPPHYFTSQNRRQCCVQIREPRILVLICSYLTYVGFLRYYSSHKLQKGNEWEKVTAKKNTVILK
jgi:hypothetical protein